MESAKKSSRAFTERLMSPTICVKLAGTDQELHLHQSRLEKKSFYFKGLISAGLSESSSKSVTLRLAPHASSAFHAIAEYMYTDAYNPCGDNDTEQMMEAATVYVMADRFLISDLKLLALNKIRNFLGKTTRPATPESDSYSGFSTKKTKKKNKKRVDSWGNELADEVQLIEATAPIFAPEYILLMKEILYDGFIDQEEAKSHESSAQDSRGDSNAPSEHNGAAGLSADQDQQLEDVPNGVDHDPNREAQLLFAQYLASHLSDLRRSEGFKNLLRTRALDGPFIDDLLCADAS